MLPLIESTSIHILPGRPSGALTPKFLSAFLLLVLKFIATLCLQVYVVCWVVDLLVLCVDCGNDVAHRGLHLGLVAQYETYACMQSHNSFAQLIVARWAQRSLTLGTNLLL